MDDFDRLLALTRAAESCNGLARSFIEYFGSEPDFSRYWTAEGQPYCEPTASMQARQRLDSARGYADQLRDVCRKWDKASGALDFVASAIGARYEVLTTPDGRTHHTGHEAARQFAEAVASLYCEIEANTDIELCFELARRLSDIQPVPDYFGRIQAEHYAASDLVPSGNGDDGEADGIQMISSLGDVPPEYRDGGLAYGEPLISSLISKPEKYGLSASYLAKNYNGPKLKCGKQFVYRHLEIAALADKKSARNVAD